jgi:hypothetical protein
VQDKENIGCLQKTACREASNLFYQLHLQCHGSVAAPRPVANSNKFHDCKIAQLLEIMVDPTMRVTFELVHKGSNLTRGELDASNTNPTEDIWRGLVMAKYNNFARYLPPFQFPDDPTLQGFDPNSPQICQRGPDILKLQYASLHMEFSAVHTKWSASGQNNPERWPKFIGGRMHLLYMFKLLEGNSAMLNMVLRLLPKNAALSSEGLSTIALKDSASRIPESGRKPATGGEVADAANVGLMGAIVNYSKGPHQASLYNSHRDLNREIMRLEDAMEDLDDE